MGYSGTILFPGHHTGKQAEYENMILSKIGYNCRSENLLPVGIRGPISIAERSEASTVFGRSNVEIAGSNPARGMDICVSLCCVVLCVGRGLASGRSPVQGVLPIV
jgi:hypothetical protein